MSFIIKFLFGNPCELLALPGSDTALEYFKVQLLSGSAELCCHLVSLVSAGPFLLCLLVLWKEQMSESVAAKSRAEFINRTTV